MTKTKLIKDLAPGDRVVLSEPDGVAVVTSCNRDRAMDIIEHADGGKSYAVSMRVVDGPEKGETIKNQCYSGNSAVAIAE
jgi:hypothetical protein